MPIPIKARKKNKHNSSEPFFKDKTYTEDGWETNIVLGEDEDDDDNQKKKKKKKQQNSKKQKPKNHKNTKKKKKSNTNSNEPLFNKRLLSNPLKGGKFKEAKGIMNFLDEEFDDFVEENKELQKKEKKEEKKKKKFALFSKKKKLKQKKNDKKKKNKKENDKMKPSIFVRVARTIKNVIVDVGKVIVGVFKGIFGSKKYATA